MDLQTTPHTTPLVCVIDDDPEILVAMDSLLRSAGYTVRTFPSPDDFIACDTAAATSCLVLDVQLEGADGLDFQQELLRSDVRVPVILMAEHGDISMTVRGMKAGAVNFLSKPSSEDKILGAISEAVELDRSRRAEIRRDATIRSLYGSLSAREREIMGLVTAGLLNKQIAGRINLSEITVKIHRGSMMRKMGAQSLADLVRMAEAIGARETSVSRFASRA